MYPRILMGILLLGLLSLGAIPTGWADEGGGNNLSFPVLWSDGVSKRLQGAYGDPVFDGQSVEVDGVLWYEQQDPLNRWQAESYKVESTLENPQPIEVSWIDWGDNLETKNWAENSVVRVETVLYYDLPDQTMLGFEMAYLYGQGQDEMWGTNTQTYASDQAIVYSACARLTIQKLQKPRNDDTLDVAWDDALDQWVGDVNEPIINYGVWAAEEGPSSPDFYSAEINIAGKVIYGYNWRVIRADGPGDYRITFSFEDDEMVCHTPLNTVFSESSQVLLAEDVEADVSAMSDDAGEEPDMGGGTAVVDHENNLSYIDVHITARNHGAGNGNQGQGGKGSQGANAGVNGKGGKR